MPITFDDLWNSYPADDAPCRNGRGDSNFDNQCAIKMGVCLADAGVDLSSCRAVRCWHGHGRRHILRAQELADWLAGRNGARILGAVNRHRSGVTYQSFSGRSGIVFFQNFWGRGNQGDHIDLWDGSSDTLIAGSRDYFSRAEEVWFWNI